LAGHMGTISELWEDIVRIKDAILIVIGFAVGSFYLGYEWKRPLPPEPPLLIATSVEISAVRSGGDTFQETPIFEQDHLRRLQEEHPDGIVTLISSVPLSHYQHFHWIVSIAPDFQSDFALSARGAYRIVSGQQPITFSSLDQSGRRGPPYREIEVEVLPSQQGDRIVVPLCIYPTAPQAKWLTDIKRMLTTRVE
jgi:hypothetical protein